LGSEFAVNVPYRSIVALLITALVTVAGDYNGDGVVSAADYIVWRNTLDQQVESGTGADGDGDGTISLLDYDVWRAEFNNVTSATAISVAVPEPSALLLLMMTLMATVPRSSGSLCGRPLLEWQRHSCYT
jgi:hypothetical protein